MQPVDEFLQRVRTTHPNKPVFRLTFDRIDRLNEALRWMLWVKTSQDGSLLVRKGVMAQGFEQDDHALLIVGGELSAEERDQLSRMAERYGAELSVLQPPPPETRPSPQAATLARLTPVLPRAALLLVVFLAVGVACSLMSHRAKPVTVSEIRAAAADWHGRTVQVSGEVLGAVDLAGATAFRLEDGTGSLTVLTDQDLPLPHSRAVVVGTIDAHHQTNSATLLVIVARSVRLAAPGRLERSLP
ncbi:hypothetical protein LLH03_13410 [bacterium]|nr:hypothetical protein [bacterium]